MDQKASSHTAVAKSNPFIPAAQLWIGPHDIIVNHAKQFLQKVFCTDQGCNRCITCTQIGKQQHHAIIWLLPEKQYTVDELSTIFQQISFALAPGERFFFIIQKADFLTAATATSLLKSIEEPAPGYHFLLLAHRLDQILPTIRSRCTVKTFYGTSNIQPKEQTDLFDYFITSHFSDPDLFLKVVEQSKINERESIELLDILLAHWIERYKKQFSHTAQSDHEAEKVITILQQATVKPPMPGSSKIFWKNIFLQIKR